MNLIRKLKISDIVPVDFTELEQGIIDLFNDKLSDLIIFIDESRPDEINYMKTDGTCIMQQDIKNHRLCIKYIGFWSVLESKFALTYTEIQILIQDMVGRAFNKNVSAPNPPEPNSLQLVGIAFIQKLSTPSLLHQYTLRRVEIALKQKINDSSMNITKL